MFHLASFSCSPPRALFRIALAAASLALVGNGSRRPDGSIDLKDWRSSRASTFLTKAQGPDFSGLGPHRLDIPNVDLRDDSDLTSQAVTKSYWDLLIALGSGSGFRYQIRNFNEYNNFESKSIHYQHMAATFLILLVFIWFLGMSLSMVYWRMSRRVHENSTMVYVAQGLHREILCCESHGVEDFLQTFDQPPHEPRLKVIGISPLDDRMHGRSDGDRSTLDRNLLDEYEEANMLYDPFFGVARGVFPADADGTEEGETAFSFALDLSPWINSSASADSDAELELDEGLAAEAAAASPGAAQRSGLSEDDRRRLRAFLEQDSNDLGTVRLHKVIEWDGWQDMALNIKAALRQKGFQGVVLVALQGDEEIEVYKNKVWAHFMRSHVTFVLAALSMVGWPIYELYLRWKKQGLELKSTHRVQVPLRAYWDLVGDKLTASGFVPAEPA